MSLQFIIGDGSKDHKAAYIEKAQEWLAQDPNHQVFFLVPNHNKFEREQDILSELKKRSGQKNYSSIRAQVFSLYRLAWYYLQQTGLLAKETVSEAGSAMILRKTLQETAEQLTIYRGEITKPGFIQQVLDLQKELQTGNVTPDDLQVEIAGDSAKAVDQKMKFAELALIFANYQDALAERNLQVDHPLVTLCEYLNTEDPVTAKPNLRQTLFIVTGFFDLQAQESALLTTLMRQGHLLVSLLLDKPYPTESPSPLNLFRGTGKMYYHLYQNAAEFKVPFLGVQPAENRQAASDLQALEQMWRLTQNQGTFEKPKGLRNNVQVWKAADPEEEVRQVAAEIRQLVALEQFQINPESGKRNFRYRDIQVLTPDIELYGQLIPHVFREAGIPFYIDQESLMEQHPIVEFLQSLFALDRYNYRLTDIMRLLKTELYLPKYFSEQATELKQRQRIFRETVDLTENIAIENNFQGYFWQQETDWNLVTYDEIVEEVVETENYAAISNRLRRSFREDISFFLSDLKTTATCGEAVEKLYHFLLGIGVEEQLLSWRDTDLAEGNLSLARNHEQTWNSLMSLMDDYYQIYGADSFDFDLFQTVFATGLESSSYSKVPTAIDQVQVNQIERARLGQAKITFAIGLNETTFPKKIEDRSLLNNEDRELLNEKFQTDQYLRDNQKDGLSQAPLNAYVLYLSAGERLYLTYAANYDTKQNIKISPYLQRIVKQLAVPLQERAYLNPSSDPANYLTSYRSLIGQLNLLQRRVADDQLKLPLIWQKLRGGLRNAEQEVQNLAQRVFESQTHQNIPRDLEPALAEKIYGKDIYASVSRLETFYGCEYKYFANYGLNLKERNVFELSPMITGDFFHDSLDRFLKILIEKNLVLAELDEETRTTLVNDVLNEIFDETRFQILQSSARMKYIRYQLGKIIQKVSWILNQQSQRSAMSPLQTEVLFGQIAGQKGIDGLTMPLSNGGNLFVRGKIDRVDCAQDEKNTWFSVVDYKSGDKKFDAVGAYYGLAMQLVTYLDVTLTNAAQLVGNTHAKPAGAYYLHIHDPILQPEAASPQDLLKQFKYNGLLVDDPKALGRLDNSLEPKETSLFFPLKADADGVVGKSRSNVGNVYAEEDLATLMQYNRQKMTNAAEKIVSGEVKLNPYLRGKNERACNYCPFRSVCAFDAMLKENNYVQLENMNQQTIIERMKEATDNHE